MSGKPKPIDLTALPKPVLEGKPEWLALYDFAWRIAARNVRHSRGRDHLDAAWDPNRNMQWVWDTCFMTFYGRYANGLFPGIQSLDNFYEMQREDGYIGMTYDMTTGCEPWPDRINPPLFAWAEWEYACATGDRSRLPRVIPPIERLMEWIDRNRRTAPHRRLSSRDNSEDERVGSEDSYQLYYFEDGGSSGMDDSPRTPRVHAAGKYVDWIDLSAQMALSFRMLAAMHGAIGNAERAKAWEARARETGDLINAELWCPATRFYHDRMIPRNFNASKTVAGFWPILAGICDGERLEALLGHLMDPKEFNRAVPVPSLSADDCNYDPKGTYWIGGVWAPTNYMITRGLMRAGSGDAAHAIAAKYMDGLARTFAEAEPHSIWENNSPDRFKPGLKPYGPEFTKPDFVGWSGLGPIAMLIENLLGFDIDALNGTIGWDIRLPGAHGLKNLLFAGKPVDLLYERGAGGKARIEVKGEAVFRLEARRGPERRTLAFKGGAATLEW
ncbi:MAG: trehalase family glycosidase [Kiritimatiellia bacterium]